MLSKRCRAVLTERRPANLQIKVANSVQRVVIPAAVGVGKATVAGEVAVRAIVEALRFAGACGTASRRTRYFRVRPAPTGGVGSYCHSSGAIGLSFSYRSTTTPGRHWECARRSTEGRRRGTNPES